MDEGGTLDFDDLMDTGDEFPGFEIAKFTPASKGDENDDDVLRTPEHEKDDEDYVVSETKNRPTTQYEKMDDDNRDSADGTELDSITEVVTDKVNKETNEVDISQALKEDTDEENVAVDADMLEPTEADDHTSTEHKESVKGAVNETVAVNEAGTVNDAGAADQGTEDALDQNKATSDTEHEESCKKDIIKAGTVNEAGAADQGTEEMKDENKSLDSIEKNMNNEESNEDSCEPVHKKKKMYLAPPQRKTVMESLRSEKNESNCSEDANEKSDRNSSDSERSRDSHTVKENGQKEDIEEDGESKGKNEEEEDPPHQQSFLSFLNLKPGSSKPKSDEMKKQESLQEEFYSRKRLRTRKKVSYCEDVAQDDDDEYNADEDDEEYDDHQIESGQPNRSRNNSRRNSGVSSYANALQNLLPGVDLSYLQNNQPEKPASSDNFVPVIATKNNIEVLKQQGNLKGLFECGICGTFFNTASQFISHQEKAHAQEKKNGRSAMETFRCEICGFVLTNRFAYLEHKKMKHQRGGSLTFSCSKCKLSKFTDLVALQKHQLVCGMPFCSTCGATFKAWVDVAEHRKQAHASTVPTRQWLNCVNKTCNFKCVTQHEMTQHIQAKHVANNLYTCNAPRCSMAFDTREKLVEHKKEAHASEFIVQYQCMECKNCFSSKTLLAEHQYLHTLEKLRKCDLCLRQFGNISDLRKHKDVHASKGTIRCQSCLRWCADKLELVNHVCGQKRRNTGIRLYFCDVCHKDFRSDEKMFVHRKEHKNFFQCASCLWECNSESEYFEHREVHGKFTCKECCEEMDETDVEMHTKAHKYYIKLEEMENNGKNEKVMFLCPNLFNAIQA